MTHFFLGLCIGSMTFLIGTLLINRKTHSKNSLLCERLAAEEASKRHFMSQLNKNEGTLALLIQQLQQKELENTILRCKEPIENGTSKIL
jgi:hypothetical protein